VRHRKTKEKHWNRPFAVKGGDRYSIERVLDDRRGGGLSKKLVHWKAGVGGEKNFGNGMCDRDRHAPFKSRGAKLLGDATVISLRVRSRPRGN